MSEGNWNFFLIKPDAIERNLLVSIRARIEGAGFVVEKWEELRLLPRDLDALYPYLAARAADDRLMATIRGHQIEYLCSGNCIYVEIVSYNENIDIFKQTFGFRGAKFLPEDCDKGSIRFDFREDLRGTPRHTIGVTPTGVPVIDGIVRNLVHCPSDMDERDLQVAVILEVIQLKYLNLSKGSDQDFGT